MSAIEIIKEYITLVLDEWDMNDLTREDFLKVWLDKHPEEEKTPEKELRLGDLQNMKKAELQELCRQRKHNDKGVKQVLIGRLLGKEIVSKKKSKKQVLQKLVDKQPSLNISRNTHGNYEHAETGLVFDELEQQVIGKQLEDGSVKGLTAEDVQVCEEYNFLYCLPENLNNE